MAPLFGAWTSLHARSDEVATKSLRSCNEVATKLDPSRIPCASPASPYPSIKESTKGGGCRRRPPPFVEAARSAASFVDGCGEAGEAQGILDGSNFVATSLQLRSDFVATPSALACKEVREGGRFYAAAPRRSRTTNLGRFWELGQHRENPYS